MSWGNLAWNDQNSLTCWRKWDRTERRKSRRGVNHCANVVLHHRFPRCHWAQLHSAISTAHLCHSLTQMQLFMCPLLESCIKTPGLWAHSCRNAATWATIYSHSYLERKGLWGRVRDVDWKIQYSGINGHFEVDAVPAMWALSSGRWCLDV